jgi:hypothetical protein
MLYNILFGLKIVVKIFAGVKFIPFLWFIFIKLPYYASLF